MTKNEKIMKELLDKYQMSFDSLIDNLEFILRAYNWEMTDNDLDSIRIAIEYINKTY